MLWMSSIHSFIHPFIHPAILSTNANDHHFLISIEQRHVYSVLRLVSNMSSVARAGVTFITDCTLCHCPPQQLAKKDSHVWKRSLNFYSSRTEPQQTRRPFSHRPVPEKNVICKNKWFWNEWVSEWQMKFILLFDFIFFFAIMIGVLFQSWCQTVPWQRGSSRQAVKQCSFRN